MLGDSCLSNGDGQVISRYLTLFKGIKIISESIDFPLLFIRNPWASLGCGGQRGCRPGRGGSKTGGWRKERNLVSEFLSDMGEMGNERYLNVKLKSAAVHWESVPNSPSRPLCVCLCTCMFWETFHISELFRLYIFFLPHLFFLKYDAKEKLNHVKVLV